MKTIDLTAIPFGLLAGFFLFDLTSSGIWVLIGRPEKPYWLVIGLTIILAAGYILGAYKIKAGWVRALLVAAIVGMVFWLPVVSANGLVF